jgi:hypothetical protein
MFMKLKRKIFLEIEGDIATRYVIDIGVLTIIFVEIPTL